jgi:hypothetical protein
MGAHGPARGRGLEQKAGTNGKTLQPKGILAKQTGKLMDLPLHLEQEGGTLDHPRTGAATETKAKGAEATMNPAGNGALVALEGCSSPGTIAMPEHVIEPF